MEQAKKLTENGPGLALVGIGILLLFVGAGIDDIPAIASSPLPSWYKDNVPLIKLALYVVAILFGLWGGAVIHRESRYRLPKWFMDLLKRTQVKYRSNRRCEVLNSIDPAEYSLLAEACMTELNKDKSVFSVLRIEPCQLLKVLAKRRFKNSKDPLTEYAKVNLSDQIADGKKVFPHFEAFASHVKSNPGAAIRVVLVTDEEWIERNKAVLPLLKALNGGVVCHLAYTWRFDGVTPQVTCLTDLVIFDNRLCLDYYDESQTLIVSHSDRGKDGAWGEYQRLKDHYAKHNSDSQMYESLDTVLTRLSSQP